MVTPTRFFPPGSLHLITRRTTQRKFLLRPDRAIVQNCLYLLGYQQERHGLGIHDLIFMSNHPHLLATDVSGDTIGPFMRDFNSLMARTTNSYRRRRENAWSSDKPNVVAIAPTAENVVDKWAYLRVNPVAAGLVSHCRKWPGARVPASRLGNWEVTIDQPVGFYDPNGSMPAKSTLRITTPDIWDVSAEELRGLVARECNLREQELRDLFRRQKRKFLGVKAVLRQSPSSRPRGREKARRVVPVVACKEPLLRAKFLKWRRKRQERYDECRREMLEGKKEVVFPEGTWVLFFFYGQLREPWTGCVWRRLAAEP